MSETDTLRAGKEAGVFDKPGPHLDQWPFRGNKKLGKPSAD